MIELLLDLPPHLRWRLADALEAGLLSIPATDAAVRSTLGGGGWDERVLAVLLEWERLRVPASAAAVWLRSLDKAASRVVPPSLVWTGPPAIGLYSRDTRQVYREMIESAQRSIMVSSYAYYDGQKAFEVLARRMDEPPHVEVTLLLNIERRRRSTTLSEDLIKRFADRFWGSDWPGTARPNVYYDPRSLQIDGPRGVLHAKAVVTDEEALFVTSANLTEAALDRNVEMGVLLRDSAIARTAFVHFRGLIEQQLLRPLPTS